MVSINLSNIVNTQFLVLSLLGAGVQVPPAVEISWTFSKMSLHQTHYSLAKYEEATRRIFHACVSAEDAGLWGSKHQPLEPVIESELRKKSRERNICSFKG